MGKNEGGLIRVCFQLKLGELGRENQRFLSRDRGSKTCMDSELAGCRGRTVCPGWR